MKFRASRRNLVVRTEMCLERIQALQSAVEIRFVAQKDAVEAAFRAAQEATSATAAAQKELNLANNHTRASTDAEFIRVRNELMAKAEANPRFDALNAAIQSHEKQISELQKNAAVGSSGDEVIAANRVRNLSIAISVIGWLLSIYFVMRK